VALLIAMAGMGHPALAAPPTSPPKQPKAASQPKSPADAQIEAMMRMKLAKSKMNADHFTFSVSKGVATIEGNTNVMQHKGAMTRMAKSSGATSVQNNIRISDAAKARATAALAKGRPAAPPGSGGGVPGASGGKAATGGKAQVAAAPVPRAVVLPPGASR